MDKKREMATFQQEYMEWVFPTWPFASSIFRVKKKYEENKKRLKDEDETITKKLKEHEDFYDQLFDIAFKDHAEKNNSPSKSSGGLFGFFKS